LLISYTIIRQTNWLYYHLFLKKKIIYLFFEPAKDIDKYPNHKS